MIRFRDGNFWNWELWNWRWCKSSIHLGTNLGSSLDLSQTNRKWDDGFQTQRFMTRKGGGSQRHDKTSNLRDMNTLIGGGAWCDAGNLQNLGFTRDLLLHSLLSYLLLFYVCFFFSNGALNMRRLSHPCMIHRSENRGHGSSPFSITLAITSTRCNLASSLCLL